MNVMEDLKAYVDGELSPERRTEIDAAMEQDERLRQELEEIRVLSRLIGDCVVEPEPVGLEQTLKLLESRRTRPFFVRLFKEPLRFGWVWAMTVFVLLAIFFPFAGAGPRSFAKMAEHEDYAATADSTAPEASAKKMASPAAAAARPEELKGGGGESNLRSLAKAPSSTGFAPNSSAGVHARRIGAPDQTRGGANGQVGGTTGGTTGGSMDSYFEQSQRDRNGSPDMPAGGSTSNNGREFKVNTQGTISAPVAQPGQPPLLVRTGDLTVLVRSVTKAKADATNIAKTFVGYIEQSSASSDANDVPTASLTLRIPEQKFELAMKGLRGLGKVLSESTTGQDVTAQVADTEARLKVMRAEEESYVGMLRTAKKVDEVLEIKDRLSNVRQEIESLDAQRKALRNQATYSTITLSLTESQVIPKPPAQPGWFDTAWDGAKERASGLGRWFAEVGMNLLVLAPIWVPVVVGIWWLGQRNRIRR